MMIMPCTRQVLTKSRMLATIGALVLGLSILPTGENVMGADAEEVIPNSDNQLTRNELRWCLFESERIDGEGAEIDAYIAWEFNSYKAKSRLYNEHCSNKTYYERDGVAVERELTAEKRQALRNDGVARIRIARADREERRVYVREDSVSILMAPESDAAELGRVPRWGELIKTGRAQGSWYEVEWHTPSLEQGFTFGWVLGGLLEGGSGKEARFEYCETHASKRAQHNEVVRMELATGGTSYITVENGIKQDAYVKIIREPDDAVLSFFAAAGKTASVKKIPNGSYDIAFATGSKFSLGCDSFSQPGSAEKFTQRLEYDNRTAGYTLTLHAVSGGNAHANSMRYDDFDKL